MPAMASDWLYYGGSQGGTHHSNLSRINRSNVSELELAWSYRTGAIERHADRSAMASFHATPILLPEEAGASLVFCTPFNRIIALDPVTGTERWAWDPQLKLGPMGVRYNCRGIAYWQDDSAPGDVQFSSPPVIVGDTVILGSSNNTKFRRIDGPSGMVRAFDARSGTLRWTFDPVPRNANDPQARNWTEAARQTTGAANVWSMMSVDAERDLVFLPTASASPDFYGGERPGDNRYANSVVALRGATGKPVWHFQIVHHDAWGFTFFDRMFCRNWLERSRTDHFYAPPSPEGTASYPGMAVNNWGGGAVNGQDLLIVPINRAIIVRSLIPVADVDPEALQHPMAGLPGRLDGTDYAQQFQPMLSPLFSPCNRPPWGELAALDLRSGKIRWRRTLGVLDKLMPVPIPLPWGTPNAGGPIVTGGGLVFIGATMDERFRAFDVGTGRKPPIERCGRRRQHGIPPMAT